MRIKTKIILPTLLLILAFLALSYYGIYSFIRAIELREAKVIEKMSSQKVINKGEEITRRFLVKHYFPV